MGHVAECFLFLAAFAVAANGQLSYIQNIASYLGYGEDSSELIDGFEQNIPYEVSVEDEKFISQAVQLTGVAVSELDSCQHRVILKLKANCHQMNDETISKVAVMLLNCQSYVEGRQLYPCTEQMSIKDCTYGMDGDAWNSYHLMSNRVRAVCYSIRQVQFRGMTEHTINRLMDTAKQQVSTLEKINNDQEKLQEIAKGTLQTVAEGHEELAQQQADLRKAQLFGQLSIEDNIKRLASEKQLIIESQEQLAAMTKLLQDKIDEASSQIDTQAKETDGKHKELIDDLISIKNKAQHIFQRIGESSNLLLKQSEITHRQYQTTLKQLTELNTTVTSLVGLVGGTKQALEDRLLWLTESLGGTDDVVEKMYVILWHSVFLLLGMIACAFLGARTSTRLAVVTLVPCNFLLTLYGIEHALDPLKLGATLLTLLTVQTVTLWLVSLRSNRKDNARITTDTLKKLSPIKEYSDEKSSRSSTPINQSLAEFSSYKHSSQTPASSVTDTFNDSYNSYSRTDDDYTSPTPPMSRNGYYASRSRSKTPMSSNSSIKSPCLAQTRLGTPCKLSASYGQNYCFRHQKGDSVMG